MDDAPETSPAPTSPTPPESPQAAWARTTRLVLIVALVIGGGVWAFQSCLKAPATLAEKAGTLIEKAGERLVSVAAAFRQGTVTTSFLSFANSIEPTHYLQFATLKQTEVFTRTDTAATAFGYIPLPDVVVEARAPVEVTYYLDLNAEWKLVLRDNVIYVQAPPIRFNKPAVDASEIRYDVRQGSVFRDAASVREALKKSVTGLAGLRAKENINLVRETGRKQTAEFVEKWLSRTFPDGKDYPVKVFFPDEKPAGAGTFEVAPLK